MKTWWLVVKHFDENLLAASGFRCQCEACGGRELGGHFPPEGFAILAFDDEERAKLYAKTSTTAGDQYEAIEVCKVGDKP